MDRFIEQVAGMDPLTILLWCLVALVALIIAARVLGFVVALIMLPFAALFARRQTRQLNSMLRTSNQQRLRQHGIL